MKNAGKARSYGLYRHLRTSKEIIENLLNYSLNIKNGFPDFNIGLLVVDWNNKRIKNGISVITVLFPNRNDNMGVTLSSFSEKQFVLFGHAADLLHLARGNRC